MKYELTDLASHPYHQQLLQQQQQQSPHSPAIIPLPDMHDGMCDGINRYVIASFI